MRTPLLATTALLLALATTGCSGGEPSSEPTPKMPSPTTSTTSPPTAAPEPWEMQSRAGVKAFLQRYVQIFSKALTTGELEDFREMTMDCAGCDEVAGQVDEVYSAGGRITTEFLRFEGWSVGANGVGDTVASTVAYRSAPVTWIRSEGAEPETYPGGKTEKIATLMWSGEGWVITDLLPVEQ